MTKTLVLMLLDESESMKIRRDEVILGYNQFVEDQKEIEEEETLLYLIKFNSTVRVVYENKFLDDAVPLSSDSYRPYGRTALYDAIKLGIDLVDKQKAQTEGYRVVFVIITDGQENASKLCTKEEISEMIAVREQNNDWSFVYIGANPRKWCLDVGMRLDNAVEFVTSDGTKNFEYASQACSSVRSSQEKSQKNVFHIKK